MRRGAAAVVLLVAAWSRGSAEPVTRTVEVVAEVEGSGLTPDEARREALARARELAVAEVAGIDVAAQQLRLKTESPESVRDLFSYLVHTSAAGRILDEQVQFSTHVVGDVPVYRAALRAEVALEQGLRDPGFSVAVDARPASRVLRDGEPLVLRIRATRECFVTVLNLRDDGEVRTLFPNPHDARQQLQPGVTLELPPPGGSYEIRADAGARRRAHEQLLVVATLDPVAYDDTTDDGRGELAPAGDASSGMTGLNRWLLRIPVERRVEALWDYEVAP